MFVIFNEHFEELRSPHRVIGFLEVNEHIDLPILGILLLVVHDGLDE